MSGEHHIPTEDVVLQAWMRDAQKFIESGVATELIAVCPVALMRICRELQHLREVTTISLLWVKAAMPTEDLVRFADGKLGCARCGAYATADAKIEHKLPECAS